MLGDNAASDASKLTSALPIPICCFGVESRAVNDGSVPHSNHACVATPRGLTEPSSLAAEPVTPVAAIVTTVVGTTTVSIALPTVWPLVASIRTLPVETPVTAPVELTVATPPLRLDQVRGRVVEMTLSNESSSLAARRTEVPAATVAVAGSTCTLSTTAKTRTGRVTLRPATLRGASESGRQVTVASPSWRAVTTPESLTLTAAFPGVDQTTGISLAVSPVANTAARGSCTVRPYVPNCTGPAPH